MKLNLYKYLIYEHTIVILIVSYRFNSAHNTLMTVSKFQEFLTSEADEVIMAFHKAGKAFERGLENKMNKETLQLGVQVLGDKICGQCAVESIRNTLISKVCTPAFLGQLRDMTFDMLVSGPVPATAHLINNLYKFYRFVNEKMPNTVAESLIPQLITASCTLLSNIESSPLIDDLKNKCKTLKEQMEEFKAKRDDELSLNANGGNTAYLERRLRLLELRWMEAPPEDFRSLSLIPTVTELHSREKPFLRPSLTQGKYPSVQDYLDVHYRLLREDFVEPIREGIREFFKCRYYVFEYCKNVTEVKTHEWPLYRFEYLEGIRQDWIGKVKWGKTVFVVKAF